MYEHMLRPLEKLHVPWVERNSGQLLAARNAMEHDLDRHALALKAGALYQRGITAAVAWHFIQAMTPDAVPAGRCPALQGFSEEAEKVSAFQAAFHGDGIYQPAGMKTSQG